MTDHSAPNTPENSSSEAKKLTREEFEEMLKQAFTQLGLDPGKIIRKNPSPSPNLRTITVTFIRKPPRPAGTSGKEPQGPDEGDHKDPDPA